MSDPKTDCIFCKIIAGTIPAEKVFEDEHTFAFLDVHPQSKGHTLVVPKAHYPNLLETPPNIRHALLESVITISQILKTKYESTGVNITSNIGASAGQVVFHTHIHVIPRY